MANDLPHRRSSRLPSFDYAQAGAYFVTVCTAGRRLVFGTVAGPTVDLNGVGRIIEEEWKRTAVLRPGVELDAFVVMPNHLHAVVLLPCGGSASAADRLRFQRSPRTLGSLVAGFKAAATARVNALRGTPGASVWQRGYFEHVVRDDAALDRIRTYISDNPLQWSLDRENPDLRGRDAFHEWLAKEGRRELPGRRPHPPPGLPP
ncbi:MAG: transposase [Thermodesulfobacteriota bacterium]